MKILSKLTILSALVIGLSSCEKVMDKKDLGTLDGSLIYGDSTLAFLNLSYIYNNNLPDWFGSTGGAISGNGSFSDESFGESKFFEGSVEPATVGDYPASISVSNNYGKIRKINEFLRDVNAGSLPLYTKNKLSAEARFFRAYRYFNLVLLYGGVPLVMEPMNPIGEENKEQALLKRNSTSDCIRAIVDDLDFAISSLPGKWSSSNDWGRITSGAAAAFKGRVLLTYASPQFNPDDLTERWQAAYDANLKAKEILTASGFGLNSNYANMWFTEVNNPEAVMVTGYNNKTDDQNKKNNSYDNATRPKYLGTSGGSNNPSWDLVKAYPMKDGKRPGTSATYAYDSVTFYKNRDPRFDATIAYNGCTWPLLGVSNYKLWTYYETASTSTEQSASNTGFYLRKAVDPSVTQSNVQYSGTDWMEIRYAEVLLNLAESACGINRLSADQEAYQGIIATRKRAGIDAGTDGLYGLTAGLSRADMFKALLWERQIEFAFEGKRFWDLRRWKLIESTLNGTRRRGIKLTLKTGTGIPAAAALKNSRDGLNLDDMYRNYFTFESTIKDSKYAINWQPAYYFFAIPPAAIINNPGLEQNNTWGGSFDPLK